MPDSSFPLFTINSECIDLHGGIASPGTSTGHEPIQTSRHSTTSARDLAADPSCIFVLHSNSGSGDGSASSSGCSGTGKEEAEEGLDE